MTTLQIFGLIMPIGIGYFICWILHRKALNAVGNQTYEDVALATEHKKACITWEMTMKDAVGEDSPVTVYAAIEKIKVDLYYSKKERDLFESELKEIRVAIEADPAESTIDEVVRITSKQKTHIKDLELIVKEKNAEIAVLRNEDRQIRMAVNADANESTYDEVVRKIKKLYGECNIFKAESSGLRQTQYNIAKIFGLEVVNNIEKHITTMYAEYMDMKDQLSRIRLTIGKNDGSVTMAIENLQANYTKALEDYKELWDRLPEHHRIEIFPNVYMKPNVIYEMQITKEHKFHNLRTRGEDAEALMVSGTMYNFAEKINSAVVRFAVETVEGWETLSVDKQQEILMAVKITEIFNFLNEKPVPILISKGGEA